MKKLISIVVIVCICVSLTSCHMVPDKYETAVIKFFEKFEKSDFKGMKKLCNENMDLTDEIKTDNLLGITKARLLSMEEYDWFGQCGNEEKGFRVKAEIEALPDSKFYGQKTVELSVWAGGYYEDEQYTIWSMEKFDESMLNEKDYS